MSAFLNFLTKWSEVWPLAIALAIFIFFRQKENVNTIIWMLLISMILHFLGSYISLFTYKLPKNLTNNNIIYNLISFIKPLLTGIYLLSLKQLKQYKYLKYTLYIFSAFTVLNFIFIESVFKLSSSMILAESIVSLIFILTFFLDAMIDDDIPLPLKHPAYFICTATGLFESINFFIFLFIFHIYDESFEIATLMMKVSSYAFIIYGTIISIGLYLNSGNPRIVNSPAKA